MVKGLPKVVAPFAEPLLELGARIPLRPGGGGAIAAHQTLSPVNGARNEQFDRQLLDQRGVNGTEQSFRSPPSHDLPAGYQLCNCCLRPREVLISSGYDCSLFYDTIARSPQRARRNWVGPVRALADFAQFRDAPANFRRPGSGPRAHWRAAPATSTLKLCDVRRSSVCVIIREELEGASARGADLDCN